MVYFDTKEDKKDKTTGNMSFKSLFHCRHLSEPVPL